MNRLLNTENVSNPAPVIQANMERLDQAVLAVKFSVEFGSFTASATSETITVASLPAGSIIIGVRLENLEAWAGGSVSAATLEFGTTGDPDKYLTASNVFSSPSAFADSGILFECEGYGASSPFTCTLRTTSDDVDQLTAGSAEVVILYATVN